MFLSPNIFHFAYVDHKKIKIKTLKKKSVILEFSCILSHAKFQNGDSLPSFIWKKSRFSMNPRPLPSVLLQINLISSQIIQIIILWSLVAIVPTSSKNVTVIKNIYVLKTQAVTTYQLYISFSIWYVVSVIIPIMYIIKWFENHCFGNSFIDTLPCTDGNVRNRSEISCFNFTGTLFHGEKFMEGKEMLFINKRKKAIKESPITCQHKHLWTVFPCMLCTESVACSCLFLHHNREVLLYWLCSLIVVWYYLKHFFWQCISL